MLRVDLGMATDFLVMPISRYLSGDFITPTMRLAWDAGGPYWLMGAVTRKIPRGEPFGGPDASARRRAFLAPNMIPGDLARYPAPIARELWDEGTNVEPRFHRVDAPSYRALLDASAERSHLRATIFFPVAFDEVFTTDLIFEGWRAGSAPSALRELGDAPDAHGTRSARATLRAALEDAMELRLPMIVDT